MMLKIQVEGVQLFLKVELIAIRPVPIGLQRKVGIGPKRMSPTPEHVLTVDVAQNRLRLLEISAVSVALYRKNVAAGWEVIEAETGLAHAPCVGPVDAGGRQ